MNSQAPTARPSGPVLAGLAVGVMAVHLLLLQGSGRHWGPGGATVSTGNRSFATRQVEAAPAPAAPVAASPAPAAPIQAPKKPTKPAQSAQPAIDSIADKPATPPAPELAPETSAAAASPTLAEPPAPPPVATASAVPAQPAQASAPALPETTRPGVVRLPPPVQLTYVMTGMSKGLTYHANAELSWNTSGSQYQASMLVSAFLVGSRSMSSSGEVTPAGLAPRRFLDKSRSERAAHFQADLGKITFSANSPDAAWMEGAQDRVSVFMQLAGMLAGQPAAYPPGSSITLYTIGPQEADTWTFLVAAEESLPLPQGETLTLKLSRKPRRQYDQAVEIWFAPSLGYLPVRSRITQSNGDFVDQQLKTLTRP